MASSSGSLHEDPDALRPETIDHHRAIVSLMEELEAIDWYDQRVDAATDQELKDVLAHNRDEEKEHAVMTLEWLRRRDAKLDEHLRTYLFTDKPVLEIEKDAEHEVDEPEVRPEVGKSASASAACAMSTPHDEPRVGVRRVMNHLLREHAPISAAAWRKSTPKRRAR